MPDSHEQPLHGGWVNDVVRIGDTVRRSAGPWTPAVHALLRHLEAKGFDAAPRVLGFDEQGREVLTYIEGESAAHPWPAALTTDAGIAAMAVLLRRYHEAVADFVPPSDAQWRFGKMAARPDDVVLHGDPGPWNVLWRDDSPVALIDWDFASPGPAISDLAFMAWYAVPLNPPEPGQEYNLDRRQRLRVLAEAYGAVSATQLLDAVEAVQAEDLARLQDYGGQGLEPWASFLKRGEEPFVRAAIAWLSQNRPALE